MNKALILTGVGAGGTAIAAGGAYISGVLDGSGAEGNTKNLKLPDNLDAFKQKGGGDKLVQDHFEDIDWSNRGQTLGGSLSLNLSNASLGGSGVSTTSKLMVNWEKYGCNGGDAGKWWGKIQWLWSILNGNDGIIFYAAAKSSSENGKLDVEGIVYVTKKEKEKSWKITHNKESIIKSPITTWKDNLPEVGEKFNPSSDRKVKDYWGFVDNGQLTGSCKSRSSETTPKSKFMGSWIWSRNDHNPVGGDISDRKILAWNKGGMKWLEKFYGQSEMSQFKDNLDTVLIGFWSEGTFDNDSLGVTTDSK